MSNFITTISKVAAHSHTQDERAVLRKWCDQAAQAGGTFAITAVYDKECGHCITYEINWPCAAASLSSSSGRETS